MLSLWEKSGSVRLFSGFYSGLVEQELTMMHLNQLQGQAQQEAPSTSGEQTMRTEKLLSGRVLVIARALWLLIALFELGVAGQSPGTHRSASHGL
jgi:hypothetical protein